MSIFYLFLCLMVVGWIAVSASGLFKEAKESTFDWEEDPDEQTISKWVMLGLIGLFAVTFFMTFIHVGQIPTSWDQLVFWVPTNLYPLQEIQLKAQGGVLYALMFDLFGTWVAVVPGEESLRALFAVFYKAYERFDWAEDLPFALQPFWIAGNGTWAAEHVLAGQNPPIFALNVFLCGELMGTAAAQSGSYVTSWIIHGLFNTIILLAIFLSGGYLAISVMG